LVQVSAQVPQPVFILLAKLPQKEILKIKNLKKSDWGGLQSPKVRENKFYIIRLVYLVFIV
jgi:hypothetical protein